MSFRALKAFKSAELADYLPATRFVLHLYCAHADDMDLTAFPSIGSLMRWTGYSERHVQRALHELQHGGHLKLVEEGGGRRKSNRYLVTLGDEQPWVEWTADAAERERVKRRRLMQAIPAA